MVVLGHTNFSWTHEQDVVPLGHTKFSWSAGRSRVGNKNSSAPEQEKEKEAAQTPLQEKPKPKKKGKAKIPTTPAAPALKVLCLHGYLQSGPIWEKKTSSFR